MILKSSVSLLWLSVIPFYSYMILLGFRYLASSIPIICFAGVAFGVGPVSASLILSLSRNPSILNSLVRWSFIGSSLVEVSGFIGLVYSFSISSASLK